MPSFFGDGNTPRRSDPSWVVLQKILGALGGGSSGSGGSIFGTTQVYENRDPAAPDDPTKAAINFPTGGGPITQWSIASQAWV